MYKLIAFDCDGTLLNDEKKIDSKTIEMIKKLKQYDIRIVLATSRPFYRVLPYLKELNLINDKSYTISFNGGLIVNNTENEILCDNKISDDVVKKILLFGQNYDLYTFIYEKDRIISNKTCTPYMKQNPNAKFEVVDFSKISINDLNVYKIIIHGDENEVKRAREDLDERLKLECEITSSNENNIEFISLGSSKSSGLDIIGNRLNIQPTDMIAFGDNENDIEMFKYVGYKVAMGNSIDALKQIADMITESNNDCGIAKALERMIQDGIIKEYDE